jgi:uncharacterized protein (TIGR02231 family)
MTLSTVALVATLAAASPAPAVPSIPAESRIDAVTVFRHQALVVRRAEAGLSRDAGGKVLRLTVAGLPPNLDEGSVQARCEGPARPSILGLTLESAHSAETLDGEVKRIEAELEARQDDDRVIADDLTRLEERRHFLRSLRESYVKRLAQRDSEVDLKQWAEAQAHVSRGLGELAAERRTLEQKRRQLAKAIAALRKRAQEIASKRATSTRVAQIDLRARQGGGVVCRVRYLVAGVGWRSSYDARLEDEVLRLTHHGIVTNRSGEDWEGVELSLSTADPVRAVRIPELYPQLVRFLQPGGAGGARWHPEAPRSLAANIPREGGEGDKEAQRQEEATFARRELHAVYTARTRASIPSTGAPRKVALATHAFRPELVYVAIPRVAEGAYLTARARNSGKLPVLAGEVRLFLGDDFIGRTQVGNVVPGDELIFSFGRDERVRVERERLWRRQREVGIFTKEIEVSERHRIRVRNLVGRPIRIGLLDQVPVSETEKIKVEVDPTSTPRTPPQPKDRPGTLRWNLDLADGGAAEIQIGVRVRYPVGTAILGF